MVIHQTQIVKKNSARRNPYDILWPFEAQKIGFEKQPKQESNGILGVPHHV